MGRGGEKRNGINVPPETVDSLLPNLRTLPYQRLAMGWARIGRSHSEIGITDPDRVMERLIRRSALARPLLSRGRALLDVGSGVGVPGLVLALADPARPVFLLEPKTRCTALIRWLLEKLPPLNLRILPHRLEELDFTRLPPVQALTRGALDWTLLDRHLPPRVDPILRWAGSRVEPPPSHPRRLGLRLRLTTSQCQQTFYWWGTPRLFHVKQSAWESRPELDVTRVSEVTSSEP